MTRDEIEALCDQLTYRPVGTTAAQMREAAALLLAQQLELADLRQYHDWAAPQIERPIEQHIVDKINDVTADRDRLAAELAECRRDAERYRWLRGRCEDYDGHATFPDVAYPAPTPDAPGFSRVDDAIDAAIAATGQEP